MTAFVFLSSTMHNHRIVFFFFFSVFMQNFRDGVSRGHYHKNRRNYPDCSYGFCEDVKQYPEEQIIAIIEKNKSFQSYFGDIVKPLDIVSTASRTYGEDPEPFCKTLDKTVAPKWMTDVDGFNRTIVNAKKYVQAVTFQTCESGQGCFAGGLFEREANCLQGFSIIKLLTANVEKNNAEYHLFRIPSTCICAYV